MGMAFFMTIVNDMCIGRTRKSNIAIKQCSTLIELSIGHTGVPPALCNLHVAGYFCGTHDVTQRSLNRTTFALTEER